MSHILPVAWAYEVLPDDQARLGPATTLVIRATGDGHTVLGIFPGPELAERFVSALAYAPHKSLFDGPGMIGAPGSPPQPPPNPVQNG